jgi:hypothetical protein
MDHQAECQEKVRAMSDSMERLHRAIGAGLVTPTDQQLEDVHTKIDDVKSACDALAPAPA